MNCSSSSDMSPDGISTASRCERHCRLSHLVSCRTCSRSRPTAHGGALGSWQRVHAQRVVARARGCAGCGARGWSVCAGGR
eukprot:3253548-Prymnesium_polylepis.1